MPANDMPAAEVDITVDLVRALLRDQASDLAGLPLSLAANGWDNVIYRLGDDLAVRLPRRELAVPLVEHEQRWLPELAPRLPLPIPAPARCGKPALGYPWPWSVVPWFDGAAALQDPPSDLSAAAQTLGDFVRALQSSPVPDDPPVNPWRGVPLVARDKVTRDAIDSPRVLALWEDALRLPEWSGPPVWLHGDLHPGNIVVDGGAISAVVDFGDLTAGDPATDLFVAWAMFPPDVRDVFRQTAGDIDDDTWARGRAWALAWGSVVIANSADNPPYRALAERMIAAVLADF
jgi:aminoglycoside phosphotransferase (APT) family kinase protein